MNKLVGIVLVNFIPKGIDMYVNKIRPCIEASTPYFFRDFYSFEYFAGMTEKQFQQFVFKCGEFNVLVHFFSPSWKLYLIRDHGL